MSFRPERSGAEKSLENWSLVAGCWTLVTGLFFCNLIFEIFIFCLLAFLRVLRVLRGFFGVPRLEAFTTKDTKKAQSSRRVKAKGAA